LVTRLSERFEQDCLLQTAVASSDDSQDSLLMSNPFDGCVHASQCKYVQVLLRCALAFAQAPQQIPANGALRFVVS
jgi:hypothetical protein